MRVDDGYYSDWDLMMRSIANDIFGYTKHNLYYYSLFGDYDSVETKSYLILLLPHAMRTDAKHATRN